MEKLLGHRIEPHPYGKRGRVTPREYAEIAAVARDLDRFGMRRSATRLRGLLGAPPNDEPPCPIQDEARQVRAIPWGLAQILYPAYGHDQTLEQVARSGGFRRVELGMLAADCYGSLERPRPRLARMPLLDLYDMAVVNLGERNGSSSEAATE